MTAPQPWIERIAHPDFMPAIGKLLGMSIVSVEEGVCVMQMTPQPTQWNPLGTLHGGVLCDLGDAAMGIAMLTTLNADESVTTIELKANYFKPIWTERLQATARVVRRTRSLGYIECDITDPTGSLVSRLSSSCMVLRGDAAKGR